MERLRTLPAALGASFKLYFEWVIAESRIKNWDFLKQWDRVLRNRIKEGRLPNFDPVSFSSAYIHFQKDWLEEPKNKSKQLSIWEPSSGSSISTDEIITRPSKRQRQQLQRLQQNPQQPSKVQKTPQVATGKSNQQSNVVCRNFAATGTCKFDPCKFKH